MAPQQHHWAPPPEPKLALAPPTMTLEERPYYYASFSPENQTRLRKMLIDRILILKNTYTDRCIAVPSDDSPLDFIHERYDAYVKDINTDYNTIWVRAALIAIFLGTEFASRWLGVDISGYAETQYAEINRYYAVLYEISEKWTPVTSGASGTAPGWEWPAEVRLIAMTLFQAMVFVGAHYAAKKLLPNANTDTVAATAKKMRSFISGISMSQISSFIPSNEPMSDKYGLPMAPGTEAEIQALEESESRSGGHGSYGGPGARVSQAPVMDIGSILGTINTVGQLLGSKESGGIGGLLSTLATTFTGGSGRPSPHPNQGSGPPRSPPRSSPISTTAASVRESSPARSRASGKPVFTTE